jgi:hypothetical protein
MTLSLRSLTLMALFSTCCYGQSYPPLPQAVSNNAVALVNTDKHTYLLSFMGLGANKGYQDIHNLAWALALPLAQPSKQASMDHSSSLLAKTNANDALESANLNWQALPDVPYIAPLAGRLASVAIGIKDQAYLFGGYTVALDHQELSTSDNYRFDINSLSYHPIADMPIAVDDSAAASYQERYIYLFGGWHQDGSVNLVQVYDTELNTWAQASPIPAPAVFGQAVGMVNNQLVLCDGVKISPQIAKRRKYQASAVCLLGEISASNHLRINWQRLPHYSKAQISRTNEHRSLPRASATAHYRMAATGVFHKGSGQIVFIGGSTNPYNYDGIGYNGRPSQGSNKQYTFDLNTKRWLNTSDVKQASMDHRGLVCYRGQLIRIGGMLAEQQVSAQVLTSPLSEGQSCIEYE